MIGMTFNQFAIPLIIGFIMDAFLGDPLWMPHPIRWFGKVISYLENKFNSGENKKLKGFFISILLITSIYVILYYLVRLLQFNNYIYYTITSVFVFYGLANRSLISESLRVEKKLNIEDVEASRKQLSFIVGRDTSNLNKNQIRVALLETLSENLSDGVIAPIFYYAVGGIPLMFTYKMVNTLDSMLGYKNVRYKDFGFSSAKIDDIFNLIPSRITAFLMVFITYSRKGLFYIFKYGNKHASPNSGFPEAALAGILNCRLGGANVYHGKIVDKPFIGTNNRLITKKDIYKACLINFISTLLFMAISILYYQFNN